MTTSNHIINDDKIVKIDVLFLIFPHSQVYVGPSEGIIMFDIPCLHYQGGLEITDGSIYTDKSVYNL